MSKIISICNQKGGTGKTTTTVNLASSLAELGKKILIVDSDPQGNATSGVGVNKNELDRSVYDLLLNKETAKDVILNTAFPNLDIIPCNINLTGAEIELVGVFSRETRLKRALDEVKNGYDFIFIDSPPSLGLLTLNSLVASDSILIPIQCEFYALEGVSQLVNTIRLIKESLNAELTIEGVLLTMADYRTNLTAEVIGEIKEYFKEKVYKAVIPRNIRLSEAPSHGKPINYYEKSSVGAIKYMELAKELLPEEYDSKQLGINDLGEGATAAGIAGEVEL
ncbi:MAG: AAA family ATPase [Candidatus Omnitrophica bacterium]|nr:AAA family ATPase [Candidatus Omnitrophota bacterium]MBU1995816.1 AAA family ATPase [Candidatus Omnitrophota bacterium]